jgi:hypothetical protein
MVALVLAACSKNSKSSPQVGTFTFTTAGKVYNWSAVCDTGGVFDIIATGIYPGTADTAQLILIISQTSATDWAAKDLGVVPDTGYYNGQQLYPSLFVNGVDYRDFSTTNAAPSATYPCILDITSNNGSIMGGTYSGMLYNQNSGGDSILMTNGVFSVQL